MTFDEFGLGKGVMESLSYMGFKHPTPVQEQAIPVILEGKDLIACAQTGSGKTAAFILPILHKISQGQKVSMNTLIIVPTRELALQIDKEIDVLGYFTNVHSFAVYGGGVGQDWDEQKQALSQGANIIVATPGKLISHLNMGYVKFSHIEHLVLDEADRMLDMGFFEDIIQIISKLPGKDKRQTLLFSATMPPKIRILAKKILRDPVEINLAVSKPAEGVLQAAYMVEENQKVSLIDHLIRDKPKYDSILIFCSTKRKVAEISQVLNQKGYEVRGISSDLSQKEREQVLKSFRSKNIRILVATDVLSRGIDIKDIQLIINYDTPHDEEDYVHRVGRTARAEATGLAITLITRKEKRYFDNIEKLIGKKVMKLDLPEDLVSKSKTKSDKKRTQHSRGPGRKSNHRKKR